MFKAVGMAPRHWAVVRSMGVMWVLAVLVLVGVGVSGGCTHDEAGRYYADKRYPRRPVKEVQVLHDAPGKPYEVIADYQAKGLGATEGFVRKKAAEIGADAVIVSKLGGYRSRDEQWAGQDRHSNTYTRITATAIRYTHADTTSNQDQDADQTD